MNFVEARQSMIAGQLKPNQVNDERILAALASVPREKFVPKALRGVAYVDEDLELTPGRYLMEPMVFARLLVAANIQPTDLVLDIAAGSGYSAAVMAQLAEAVVAIDCDPDLVGQAESRMADAGVDNAAVIEASLTDGAPKQGPFDVILINGGVEVVPPKILAQLKEGGRLVCVKYVEGSGRATMITNTHGVMGVTDLFDARVPVLADFRAPAGFVF